MVLIEMRESVYNKAFDLIDKAKAHGKEVKLALCELEQCLEDCYQAEVDDDEYEGEVEENENYTDINNIEIGELNYRHRPSYRRGAMRKSMRMRGNMRKNNLNRYSY